jgi:hypothetical protein
MLDWSVILTVERYSDGCVLASLSLTGRGETIKIDEKLPSSAHPRDVLTVLRHVIDDWYNGNATTDELYQAIALPF